MNILFFQEVDGLMFNVIVTSYEIAMNDRAVLAPVRLVTKAPKEL